MPDTPRQPPEKICDHFDWNTWTAPGRGEQKCKVGVEYRSVSHGLSCNFCIATVPCYDMCDKAKCAKRVLPAEVQPETADDNQLTLF